MQLRIGYELRYHFPQPTPVILMLNVHDTRIPDLERPDAIVLEPPVPISGYSDVFANQCSRILAPAGAMRISTDTIVRDTGLPDPSAPDAAQVPIQDLPDDTLTFLIASRYCDSDRLLDLAWTLFGRTRPGWARVQAVSDFVHQRIAFGYEHASVSRSAWQAYEERRGVCRDYAHLAIAFCRALNIPARYCTGYLGDVGTPPPYPPGDFAAWFEAYLGGQGAGGGIRSTRETMCRASAGSCWREVATRRMLPSPPRSARIHWRAFACGPTRWRCKPPRSRS